MSRLDLYLFGAFEVARNGRLLTASDWRSQQNRTILKVLAAHDGQVVTSEQLLDVLWPGDASPAARRRLHVRISQLRALLADGGAAPAVETVKGGYRFSRENGSWLDVAAFEALARQGSAALEARALETAVAAFESARALYRDDFLVEDLYESWTVARREQLREQHLTLLVELAESYAQQGRFRQAIACCHDALTADAYREPVYVRLMLYHYYAGEQAQALRIFARCRDLLQRELAVAPLPATVALMAQIRDGTLWAQADAPRYPPPAYSGRLFAVPYSLGNPPLVGRAREYAWLVERWRDPAARVVLVEGEAGIGKTRLVQALLGYAQAGGVAARQLRVDPAGEPPHAALLALADGGGADQAILFVDNAHLLPESAGALLGGLAERATLVLAARGAALPPALRRLADAALRLGPLPETAVAHLIRQLAAAELPRISRQVWQLTQGNPFYVIAVLQHLFETGRLLVDGAGRWQAVGETAVSLPPTLRDAVAARLARLRPDQRQVFDLTAVAGGGIDFEPLQRASRLAEEALLDVVDELIAAGLLVEPRRPGLPAIAVAHDLYREVALETLTAARQRRYTRQLAA